MLVRLRACTAGDCVTPTASTIEKAIDLMYWPDRVCLPDPGRVWRERHPLSDPQSAGCWKRPPASFSHHSDAQRTNKSTPRLLIRCGLAGRPFWTSRRLSTI